MEGLFDKMKLIDIMVFVVFEILLLIGLSILFTPLTGPKEISNFKQFNLVSLIWYTYSLIILLIIAKRRNVLRIWIRTSTFFKDLLWTLKVFPIVTLTLIVVSVVFPMNDKSYVEFDIERMDFIQKSLFIFLVVLLGPITEELIFRGMVYNFLKKFMKVELAIILTSITFSLFHPIEMFPEILVLSIMMNYFYETRGSLVVPITLHSLNNTVALLSLFILGGG